MKDESQQLITEGSIVVLGNFNPAIFHPEWFRSYKIIAEQEIAAAETPITLEYPSGVRIKEHHLLVSPQETSLIFQSFHLDVTPERYQAIIRPGYDLLPVKETTIKIFQYLSHTPVKSVGINFNAYWKMDDDSKTFLNRLFSLQSGKISVLGDEYLVEGRFKFNRNNAEVTFRIERSPLQSDGIYLDFNFHREIPDHRTETLVELIRSSFDTDRETAKEIATGILGDPERVIISGEKSNEHGDNK